jgi:hypothetical protein
MPSDPEKPSTITLRKNFPVPAAVDGTFPDTLSAWLEAYFAVEVTTAPSSQRVQRRDLQRFLDFVRRVEAREDRTVWTARLSRAFVDDLKAEVKPEGGRRTADGGCPTARWRGSSPT